MHSHLYHALRFGGAICLLKHELLTFSNNYLVSLPSRQHACHFVSFTLSLVSAQDACKDTTVPQCCGQFLDDMTSILNLFGPGSAAPAGAVGVDCSEYKSTAGCSAPMQARECRYVAPLMKLALGCVAMPPATQ